jgi:hypothetical protein
MVNLDPRTLCPPLSSINTQCIKNLKDDILLHSSYKKKLKINFRAKKNGGIHLLKITGIFLLGEWRTILC